MMADHLASAIFDSRAEAERAVADLREAGVPDAALSVVTQNGERSVTDDANGDVAADDHSNVVRGILGGGALGAGLGIAALAIPGVGPLVAAGAIAAAAIPGAAAIGAATGAVAGTVNETLKGHGVSDSDADYYGDRLGRGGVFVSVDTRTGSVPSETVSDILYRNGGHNASRSRAAAF